MAASAKCNTISSVPRISLLLEHVPWIVSGVLVFNNQRNGKKCKFLIIKGTVKIKI